MIWPDVLTGGGMPVLIIYTDWFTFYKLAIGFGDEAEGTSVFSLLLFALIFNYGVF